MEAKEDTEATLPLEFTKNTSQMGHTKEDLINLEEHQKTEEHRYQEQIATEAIAKLQGFAKDVREMRRHQRAYVKHKSGTTLEWAKKEEAKVDKFIDDLYNPQIFG